MDFSTILETARRSGRATSPSIPPTSATLRPLMAMVARAIEEMGPTQAALLCSSIADRFAAAAFTMRVTGARPGVAVVTVSDIEEMAAWLASRGRELAVVQ